jgi:hypothetical protein
VAVSDPTPQDQDRPDQDRQRPKSPRISADERDTEEESPGADQPFSRTIDRLTDAPAPFAERSRFWIACRIVDHCPAQEAD